MSTSNGAQQEDKRQPTERVILKLSHVIVVPEDITNEQLEKIAQALGVKRALRVIEAWTEVSRQTAATKRQAIELHAGKPGTPDAEVGMFRAPSVTAWKDGVRYVAPPKPLVEASVIE